ncbi:MAG: DUF3037 domain-containing protein [Ginsengibacter sp.]|jgi:hypothetical protein
MHGKHLFEYAVVRIVPRVEREEFFNAGVILYCAGKKFLDVQYFIDPDHLASFKVDIENINLEKYLHGFKLISRGGAGSGPIGQLPPAERFRWLTATRSTVLQTSKVHPGFCDDPAQTLQVLFETLVLNYE